MHTMKTKGQAAWGGGWRVGVGGVLLCLGLVSGAQGAAMPKKLAPVAIGVMQRDVGPRYQMREERTENAAQGWRLGFSREGVEVRAAEGKAPWTLNWGSPGLGARSGSRPIQWSSARWWAIG